MKKVLYILFHRSVLVALSLLAQVVTLVVMVNIFSEYINSFYWCCIAISVIAALLILGSRIEPAYKIAWLLLILPFPVFGGIFYLLVGGGIGIPPMLGCAQYTQGKSTAILGGRSADKIILQNCFQDECAKVLVATDDGSLGHHGFVDALVRQELEQDKNYDGVLACGPKPMLRNVARVAEEFGVPCQVSMEERMGCGVGACLVCACDMADGSRKHVCKDGPVFDSREVNWDV